MVNQNENFNKIIDKIIEIELEMFLKVRTSIPSLCQQHPNSFRIMRRMGHVVLSLETLSSYLNDLRQAREEGRNLLTEKYARMDKLIPPIMESSIINKIVNIEDEWLDNLAQKYPLTIVHHKIYFRNYLSCELETYSIKTLELYYKDIINAKNMGRSLAEERYNFLFRELGYDSIEDVEIHAKGKK